MPRAFPMRMLAALTLAAGVLALAGCQLGEEARALLNTAQQGSFKPATRTFLEQTPDGARFVLRVESRRKAHWYEAMSALTRDLGSYCPDGAPFSSRRMTPAHDPRVTAPGEYIWHPAGTVFEEEITCKDPFAGERIVPADTDTMAALDALKTELVAGAPYDSGRHLHTVVTFNDRKLKYPAVSEIVGSMVLGANQRCGDAGVVVQRVVLHAKPTPDPSEGVFLNRSEAYLGVDVVCADGQPADLRR